MTKKDFELIARVLNKYGLGELDNNRFNHLTKLFSDTLASKNPRFDKEKFLKACGVEVDTDKCKYCISGYNPKCICCKGSRYID